MARESRIVVALRSRFVADIGGMSRSPAQDRPDERPPRTRREVAESAYEASGFRIDRVDARHQPVSGGARPVRPTLTRVERFVHSADRVQSLRWAIRIGAHAGAAGDSWGDVFFADDLANALRRLGQSVVIDRLQSVPRTESDYLDDVTLTLRGLHQPSPNPLSVNMMWVISHPEAVTRREVVEDYDVIFAASEGWARRTRQATGSDVRALLQATEPRRFHPGDASEEFEGTVLFVGRSRGVMRPIVRDARELGIDIAIYGDDWEQFLGAGVVRSMFMPNDRLPSAYRSARIVLNDHWADMRESGFISNRLFDAAATGARVVSDPVAGLESLFSGLVRTYESREDLARLILSDDGWPDAARARELAQAIGAQHSFDRRAETLLDAALNIRRADR
jgi:hypothetical protein